MAIKYFAQFSYSIDVAEFSVSLTDVFANDNQILILYGPKVFDVSWELLGLGSNRQDAYVFWGLLKWRPQFLARTKYLAIGDAGY